MRRRLPAPAAREGFPYGVRQILGAARHEARRVCLRGKPALTRQQPECAPEPVRCPGGSPRGSARSADLDPRGRGRGSGGMNSCRSTFDRQSDSPRSSRPARASRSPLPRVPGARMPRTSDPHRPWLRLLFRLRVKRDTADRTGHRTVSHAVPRDLPAGRLAQATANAARKARSIHAQGSHMAGIPICAWYQNARPE